MAQYDGSIRINTQINTKQAKVNLATLENRMVKTADKIASLRSKMDALKDVKIPTQEYTDLQKEIGSTEKKLLSLYDRQERFLATGGKEDSSAYKKMAYDAETLEKKLQYAEQAMQSLVDSGKAFTFGKDTEEYAKLGQQLKYAENEMSVLEKRHDLLLLKQKKVSDKYNTLKNSAASAFQKIGGSIKSAAIAPLKSFGNSVKNTFSNIGKSANKSSGIFSKFGSRIKELALSAFLFNQVSKLFSSMISGIKDGMGNLAGFSEPVKSSMSSLQSSLTQLKNSLATAFAPIFTAAAPALTALIDMASKAATAVGMLIAALTGQKTFAKATKVQEGYADSLGGTAKAAKEANKQLSPLDRLNNMTTNDSGGSGGGGGAGAGAGDMFETVDIPSQIGNIAEMIKNAWANADFTEIGTMIGTKLKTALDNIPWGEIQESARKIGTSIGTLINGFVEVPGLGTKIGETIGQGINTGIILAKSFIDATHWDSVGKFIGDGLNGAVSTINWTELGGLVASGVNAIFQTIQNTAQTFEWTIFGNSIAAGINSAVSGIEPGFISGSINSLVKGMLDTLIAAVGNTKFDNVGNKIAEVINGIDWVGIAGKTATSLSELVGGMLDLLIGFVEGTDWGQLGIDLWNSLVSAVTNIKWSDLVSKIFELLGAAIAGVVTFNAGILEGIGSTLMNLINGAFEWAQGEIEAAGGNIFLAMLNGIVDIAKGIGKWVKDNIFDPFIKGIKKAFGINGDSKVMSEQGTAIMNGLISGISSLVDTVVEKFNFIKDKVVGAWDKAKEKTSEAWGNVKRTVSDTWDNMKTTASDKFSNIKKSVTDSWENIKKNTGSIWDGAKGVAESVKSKWRDMKTTASDKFSNIKKSVTDSWENIKKNTKTNWDNVKEKVSGAFDVLKDKSGISNTIKDTVGSAWENIKSSTESTWEGIKNAVKAPINAIIGFINSLLSGMQKMQNGLVDMLNKIKIKTPAWLEKITGVGSVGFNLSKWTAPQIPNLATGAVIPPNREFLAVLGDQKHGTNIEAPLSTIEQAVENALKRNGGSGGVKEVTIKVPVEIDGRVLFELMKKFDLEQFNRTGRPSFQI